MSLEVWLAFVAASAVLLVIPGPTILLVVSYALGRGWKVAAPVATGVALGDLTAMTLSMLGVGALLASSATLFTVLKWIGAGYLIWLGIGLWRAGGTLQAEVRTEATAARRMLAHAWLVTTLNPKSIIFFVAFLPQFLDPAGDVPDADGDLRGDLRHAGLRQCLRLCAARLAGAAACDQPAGDPHRQPGRRHGTDCRRRGGGDGAGGLSRAMTARYAKIGMVLSLAVFAFLVSFTNLTDPGGNRPFVQHVLSMDTTFRDPAVAWRAIDSPWVWRLGFALIVAGEALTCLLFALAGLRMLAARNAPAQAFNRSKRLVHLAALAGFLVWFLGFMAVGGEWFLMWQSPTWNGQEPAFRFYATILLVLIYVNQPDGEPDAA